jgi:uncharacterized protein YuzE
MPITAEYDSDADALYVRLADGVRARTVEIDDSTYIDVDPDDRPIGIELLYPSMGLNLRGAAERLALESQLADIIRAITESGAPVTSLTMTGGQYLASTTMFFAAAEGTVAAAEGTVATAVAGATASLQPQPLILAGCQEP